MQLSAFAHRSPPAAFGIVSSDNEIGSKDFAGTLPAEVAACRDNLDLVSKQPLLDG